MRPFILALAVLGASACNNDIDGDGIDSKVDCDDYSASVYPDAPELCDGVDNDCDGEIDEEATDAITFYIDADDDRFGSADTSVTACEPPEGYVEVAGDCDDGNAAVNSGSVEICNQIDDNCDGAVDEGAAAPDTWYRDRDGDQWGVTVDSLVACEAPEGYVAADGDCDDATPVAHPGGIEICNGVDDDCNGAIDDSAVDVKQWYYDEDGDEYGAGEPIEGCFSPGEDFVLNDADCDDRDDRAYPGGVEVCDVVDNDCNGLVDENALDAPTYYRDADSDTYGDASFTLKSCSLPDGYVSDDTDCDDLADWTYPGADEVCDGEDNNCDTSVDNDAIDMLTWYADADGDGAGDRLTSVEACEAPTGYVSNDLDCDDADSGRISGCFAETPVEFNPCGVTGHNGPTQSDCDTEYSGTDLDGLVTVSGGMQTITFPESGTWSITAYGAQGASATASYSGGAGAMVYGEFTFSGGDEITILVGQQGSRTSTTGGSGGGGGATWIEDDSGTLLMVAGGGGGTRNDVDQDGCDAVSGNYGVQGSGSGRSGHTCPVKTSSLGLGGGAPSLSWGSGGGGYSGDGTDDGTYGTGGKAFSNGGQGGTVSSTACSSGTNSEGGFGSGGSGAGCWGGGGGGGYSGGDGGRIAGGGGSYNTGSNPSATGGVNTGDGYVVIERL